MENHQVTSKRFWFFKCTKTKVDPVWFLNPALFSVSATEYSWVGAAVRQSAGICGARCGPTGVAHHQNIEVGSPGADGMVNHCSRSERCHQLDVVQKGWDHHPRITTTIFEKNTIPSYSKIIIPSHESWIFKKNLDFRSSHGINLGYVHGIFMGIYYNGMLLSGNSLYPLVNINIAMENHDV